MRGPLAHGRTIILVTHAVSLCLPIADLVVGLEDGSVIFAGSAADASVALSVQTLDRMEVASLDLSVADSSADPFAADLDEGLLPDSPTDDKSTQPFGLINRERRAVYRALRRETASTGAVSSGVYLRYARAIGSGWAWMGIIALLIGYWLLEAPLIAAHDWSDSCSWRNVGRSNAGHRRSTRPQTGAALVCTRLSSSAVPWRWSYERRGSCARASARRHDSMTS